MNECAVELRDVHKTYGRGRRAVHALRGVSLQVSPGEIFGLLGPNGAGKSTLVKIMMTVVRPDRAEGMILGEKVGHKRALSRVGYLPEHHRFPRYLTARQLLDFFGAMSGVPRRARRQRAEELLDLVGMKTWADRRMDTYSKGMMQRVGVAQALVNDPRLVVLDEPTDGVDPIGRQDIREVLRKLRDEGRTVFVNSHLLSELEMISDRVAIMVKGQVVRQGTISELASHRQWYELEITRDTAQSLRAIFNVDGQGKGLLPGGKWLELVESGEGVIVKVGTTDPLEAQGVLDRLRQNQCVVRRLELVRPSLEALFMEAVGDNGEGASVPEGRP